MMSQVSETPNDDWRKLERGVQSLCFCAVVFLVSMELLFAVGLLSPGVSLIGTDTEILTAILAVGVASLSLAILYLAFRLSNDRRS